MQIVSRAHGCILLKFYIKPQQPRACVRPRFVVSYWNSTSNHNYNRAAVKNGRLYLIEILHQTTTFRAASGGKISCILLKFYIKPQQSSKYLDGWPGCILLKFYIKPQLAAIAIPAKSRLYLIEILHQTTTLLARRLIWASCILLKFYIKPQQSKLSSSCSVCCILLKFYIKPQQRPRHLQIASRCILLKFYIKPQPIPSRLGLWKVVSYWNSTSNHNIWVGIILANLVVSYWNSTSNHNTT